MEQLAFDKTIKLLEKYKLPYSKSKLASSLERAAKFAKEIGFPVALKVISKDIVHKSEANGVKTNLNNEEEVVAAYGEILKSSKKKFPRAKIDGILVQRMEQGIEVIIGMNRDPQFDAVIMFGLGGVFVEVLKDVSFRIAPIDKKEAEGMIKEIRSKKILEGARGRKPVNISALADMLVNISKLSENKKILEIDLNPVVVDDKSARVVDVRMMIE